jgi:hypothetical protein
MVIFLMGASPITVAGAAEIVVAVRDNAAPLISHDKEKGGYATGFLWDVCTEAVSRAGYTFEVEVISADERRRFIRVGKPTRYDLLCDPTTINLSRLKAFTARGAAPQLSFSPIVFVANGSYAIANVRENSAMDDDLKSLSDPCPELISRSMVKDPDQKTNQAAGSLPRFRFVPDDDSKAKTFEIWGYVEGSTIGEILVQEKAKAPLPGDNRVICPREMPSHTAAAREFCERRLQRYYGDVDIVRAEIAAYVLRTKNKCEHKIGRPNGTYEPYAFVMSSINQPDFPELFTLALYSMFNDGTMEGLFAAHFPDKDKSPHLATLFRINRIPSGQHSLGGQRSACQIGVYAKPLSVGSNRKCEK